MSKKRQDCDYEQESSIEELTNIDIIESYIEASEMYLEALKLSDNPGSTPGYMVGMNAVYFGKAYLSFISSENKEAIKGSLKEAINAYIAASSFCEQASIGKQFIYTSRLIIATMREELSQ